MLQHVGSYVTVTIGQHTVVKYDDYGNVITTCNTQNCKACQYVERETRDRRERIVVNRDNLNSVMEFDHVVYSDGKGNVTWSPNVVAPEVYWDTGTHHMDTGGVPWSLMSGYTGQYGYNGPVMHTSEFIGGTMADDILSEPGYYVALVVEDMDDPDNPAGWVVAHLADFR